MLVEWIFYCSARGFAVTKSQFLGCVQKLITDLKRKTPFANNLPGRTWWELFSRRHPEVSNRVAQNLSVSRVSATASALQNWFSVVEEHLKKLDLLNIDASRVYNLDESAFFLIPKAEKVLARRGSKCVYKVVNGDEKESLTVLFTVNAEGTVLPPMILFWYDRIPAAIMHKMPSEWIVGNTDKGWMTAECFYKYISEKFYPWLVEHKIEFPIVLYVDGHVSHMTLQLARYCKSKQIELIALYPNATHVLQPLDVAVFHPLKVKWRKTVDDWRTSNGTQKLKRENFAPLLKKTLDDMPNLKNTIINGFRTCGLRPFTAKSVDFNILDKNNKSGPTRPKLHSPDSEIINLDSPNSEQNKYEGYLKILEDRLDPTVLDNFRSGRWELSSISYEELFNHWQDVKNLTSGALIL